MNEKYALINAEKADPTSQYPTDAMCRWVSVSRSGFYEWRTAAPSAAARRRVLLSGLAAAAFEAGRGTYGARRVRAVLIAGGQQVSLRLIRRLLREQGLRACQPRAAPGLPDHHTPRPGRAGPPGPGEPGLHRAGSGGKAGRRHHPRRDVGGLALCGHGHRLLLAAGHQLGHGRQYADTADHDRPAPRDPPSASAT